MKEFLLKLWNGEPVFVFGLLNTILVAVLAVLDSPPQWYGIATTVVVATSTYLARSKVSPSG